MILSFFESLKYVGHLYPIAALRIYVGGWFLLSAIEKTEGYFLTQPRLAAKVMEFISTQDLPLWYMNFLQDILVPNWQITAYLILCIEVVVGISFILGFLVRPAALLGIFLTVNSIFMGFGVEALQQTFCALFVVLYWVGAGRCLGFDYYFYKRRRELWW